MVRPTINSIKHIPQLSLANTAAGALTTSNVVKTVANPDGTAAIEVRVGSIIKAIYVEMWIRGSDAGVGSSYVYIVEKAPAAVPAVTVAQMADLHNYPNKKNVLWSSMGLVNDDTNVATPVLRQWIKIPKGKQRFGLDDKIRLVVFAQSGSQDRCGFVIFKEYF